MGSFGDIKFHTKVQGLARDGNDDKEEKTLAMSLASLVKESSNVEERKPRRRGELKRFLELRIKRRVKEQYVNGKFQDLMLNVIANPETLMDAYDIIRVSSNVDLELERGNLPFESMAEELSYGNFDVSANTYSVVTRGGPDKEVLVLPNVKLRIIQEAIRIVLEIVYKSHFSKISHGGRDGRDHLTALRYIRKEISDSSWWFTLLLNQKVDACILNKLFSTMENKIEDPGLYAIMRSMFHAQVLNFEFGGFSKGQGLPQEGVLSPILMNIYLDLFDREVYRMSMRYEALDMEGPAEDDGTQSKLRTWFRRQIHCNNGQQCYIKETSSIRLRCCRFMDEILVAISGSKEIALASKLDMENYLKNFLHIEVDNQIDVLPCDGPSGVRFLGTAVKRTLKESPAVRAVHKLKEKVKLFASQKQESWDVGTIRIGKKWLAHGLKKVKESEIKHLAESNSTLNRISCFRKAGMETDHWYKILLKVWMQNINAKNAESEEFILSKHIVEPALPRELVDSYYEFQKCVEDYISSETTATLALLPNTSSSIESHSVTQIIAPVNAIKKRLQRYGLTNSSGFPQTCYMLILHDDDHIIDWFSGLVSRFLNWYKDCDNYDEVKLIVSNQVRLSCIRTLAAKYSIHETEIEKRFDSKLSGIPSTTEIEHEVTNEDLDYYALFYGISYSGLCLLSLARKVSQSRPCNCFVMGCKSAAPCVYTLHVMEKQKFPSWKTGFSSCIHASLNRRKFGLCKQHLGDLFLGRISLQSINFGAWR